ncbi:MAG: nucleoside kinase [Bacilli bacterium]|nr:nucleoside kinase [Bacilli bacterium]
MKVCDTMDKIIITFENGKKKEYKKGIKLFEIIESIKNDYSHSIISAKFKNQLISYDDALMKNGDLVLFDIMSPQGNKIYERGLIFMFQVCTQKILGKDTKIKIRHPIDRGIFCEIDKKITEKDIEEITKLMKEKVKEALPFEQLETSRIEAIDYFKKLKRYDKVKTLSYTTSNFVKLYKFDGVYNYIIGDLPHDSSILKLFKLTLLKNKGVVLRFPFNYDNGRIKEYVYHEKYVNSLDEYAKWGNLLNINNIGELNEAIIKEGSGEIINLSETIQDHKLFNIAEEISKNNNNIKLVLLSGPSSSGKTTTAKKLALYLKTLGLKPIPISIDDYFLERVDTPLGADGKPDYEGLRALDIKLFNRQLKKILEGNEVITPTFNFITGKKEFNKPIKLDENGLLIVEGLHALNDSISKEIPKENKYKIYISPLIFLNIDNDNRISLTDIRLLRRMVRDYRTRGKSPTTTLETWTDVRIGEEQYVFPYQDDADVIFNSFLAYELGVLKTYVEPLLYSVQPEDKEYHTAMRLLKILKLVLPIPSNDVPQTSILREFIGESYFEK